MSNTSENNIEPTESGLDIAGIGQAMHAIPPNAWERMVDTACVTFEKILSPITETTYGIGRLIQAKFDRLIDVEKVMAAESIITARQKAEKSGQMLKIPKPQILLQVVENSSDEVDGGIRELWSNLLAQEFLTQGIHPEIGRILTRLSFEDAQLLVTIAEQQPTSLSNRFAKAMKMALKASAFGIAIQIDTEPMTFNHAHLRNLGLVDKHEGQWELTVLGEGFIQGVTDPSL